MGIMHSLVIVNIILKLIKYLIRMDKRKLDYVPLESSLASDCTCQYKKRNEWVDRKTKNQVNPSIDFKGEKIIGWRIGVQ